MKPHQTTRLLQLIATTGLMPILGLSGCSSTIPSETSDGEALIQPGEFRTKQPSSLHVGWFPSDDWDDEGDTPLPGPCTLVGNAGTVVSAKVISKEIVPFTCEGVFSYEFVRVTFQIDGVLFGEPISEQVDTYYPASVKPISDALFKEERLDEYSLVSLYRLDGYTFVMTALPVVYDQPTDELYPAAPLQDFPDTLDELMTRLHEYSNDYQSHCAEYPSRFSERSLTEQRAIFFRQVEGLRDTTDQCQP